MLLDTLIKIPSQQKNKIARRSSLGQVKEMDLIQNIFPKLVLFMLLLIKRTYSSIYNFVTN